MENEKNKKNGLTTDLKNQKRVYDSELNESETLRSLNAGEKQKEKNLKDSGYSNPTGGSYNSRIPDDRL